MVSRGTGFIEAHHLTPFAELHGRPTQLDAATDFIVGASQTATGCSIAERRRCHPTSLSANSAHLATPSVRPRPGILPEPPLDVQRRRGHRCSQTPTPPATT